MRRLLLIALSLLPLCSCQNLRKVVKASPAELSPFVQNRERMTRQPADAAFQFTWAATEKAAVKKAQAMKQIYVAPVSLAELRPMLDVRLRGSKSRGEARDKHAPELAAALQKEFAEALQKHPAPHYTVVGKPGANTLVLELAVTELNPTSVPLSAAKLAASLALGPAGSVGGLAVRSAGNIAIEGRLRAGTKGAVVYQFADNESDKLTFYSIRDFRPYGHAKVTIREWARQFAEVTQGTPGAKVKDATFWTLSPF